MKLNQDTLLPANSFMITRNNGEWLASSKHIQSSLVCQDVQLGQNVSVVNSVIGRGCKIGDNTKISNSVIMNYVNIENE